VIQTKHGTVEVADSEFFGVLVKRAFIITSRRSPVVTVK
jgi:hypothetical protein